MNSTEQSKKTLVIHPSQGKIILTMVVVGLVFWSALTSLFSAGGFLTWILKLINLPVVVITGYVLYFLFQKLSKKIPSLVIDEKGIYDDVLPFSVDQITWDEIDFVEIYTMETEIPFFDQVYLGVVLKDVEAFKQKLDFIEQKIVSINHWFPKFKAQVNIPLHMVGTNEDEVVAYIKEFHPEKLRDEHK